MGYRDNLPFSMPLHAIRATLARTNLVRTAFPAAVILLVAASPGATAQTVAQNACGSVLRDAGEFLVVNDTLEPASAIVVLDGGSPQRETEAAKLYRAGWAPRVVIVPGMPHADQIDDAESEWASRSDLLERLGVPADAITVSTGQAHHTRDELQEAATAVGYGAEPVILVTSKAHTRRVAAIWDSITRGEPPAIVRAASEDSFDPQTWWTNTASARTALHEFGGLVALPLSGR
jgi:uncharacterized SAM-binding protein YcdF (DUF218 family)